MCLGIPLNTVAQVLYKAHFIRDIHTGFPRPLGLSGPIGSTET